MTATGWLRDERAGLATQQILDAAGELFAERGVAGVRMAEVAAAAGCSRATLYRYFDGREALRTAFVHREARRIGTEVAAEIAHLADPGLRLEHAIAASLRLVRADATLSAWFSLDDAASTSALAQSSAVIEGLVARFLGDGGDPEVRRRARWIVRILVSLLADPEVDPDDERAIIEEFVVPSVLRGH